VGEYVRRTITTVLAFLLILYVVLPVVRHLQDSWPPEFLEKTLQAFRGESEIEVCEPPEIVSNEAPESGPCLEKESVVAYLRDVRRATLIAWDLPTGLPAHRCVVVRFSLRRDGNFDLTPQIIAGENARLRESILHAFLKVAPFPPLPPTAECLAGIPVRAAFSNPPEV
jgi:hypothetical protein